MSTIPDELVAPCNALQTYDGKVASGEALLASLWPLCAAADKNALIAGSPLIALLVSRFAPVTFEQPLAQKACMIVGKLAEQETTRDVLLKNDAILFVTSCLGEKAVRATALYACYALRNLCTSMAGQVKLAKSDGITILVSVLNRFAEDAGVAEHAIGALRNILLDLFSQLTAAEKGAFQLLGRILALHMQSEQVVLQACAALRNIGLADANELPMLKHCGSIFLTILQTHSTNRNITFQLLKLLKSCSVKKPNLALLLELNVVPALVNHGTVSIEDDVVVQEICATLKNIAFFQESHTVMLEKPVIEFIRAVLSKYMFLKSVSEECLACLRNIAPYEYSADILASTNMAPLLLNGLRSNEASTLAHCLVGLTFISLLETGCRSIAKGEHVAALFTTPTRLNYETTAMREYLSIMCALARFPDCLQAIPITDAVSATVDCANHTSEKDLINMCASFVCKCTLLSDVEEKVAEAGALEFLKRLLYDFPEEKAAILNVALVARNLTVSQKVTQQMVDGGSNSLAVAILRKLDGDCTDNVVEHLLATMANVSLHQIAVSVLLENGIIKRIVQSLREQRTQTITDITIALLRNMLVSTDAVKYLETEGGITTLIEIMSKHINNGPFISKSCPALINLAVAAKDYPLTSQDAIGDVLSKAAQIHVANAEYITPLLAALRHHCVSPSSVARFLSADGLDLLAHAFEIHAQTCNVAIECVAILQNITLTSSAVKEVLVSGAYTGFLHGFASHISNPRMALQGAWFMRNISADESEAVIRAAVGGVRALWPAINAHKDNAEVNENVLLAFRNFSVTPALRKAFQSATAIPELFNILKRFTATSQPIVENALVVLRNLSLDAPSLTHFKPAPSAEAFDSVIAAHPSSEIAVVCIVSILAALCVDMEKRAVVKSSPLFERLKSLRATLSPTVPALPLLLDMLG